MCFSSVKVNGESTESRQAFTEGDAHNPQDDYGLSKHEGRAGFASTRCRHEHGGGHHTSAVGVWRRCQGQLYLPHARRAAWPALAAGCGAQPAQPGVLNNLVDFIVTCITHPQTANQTFLVSDGHDLSTTELIRGLARAAGVPARLLPVPVWALQAGAAMLGKRDVVQRLCGNLQVDISKARSLLGWTPLISVEEGLRQAVAGAQKP